MNRLVGGLICATLLSAVAAMAEDLPPPDQCQRIVSIHAFMLDLRKSCPIELQEDTSDLAYQCASSLGRTAANKAVSDGQSVAAAYRMEHPGDYCRKAKLEYAPLINSKARSEQPAAGSFDWRPASERWHRANADCRGTGDLADIERACRARETLTILLETHRLCFDASENTWDQCEPDEIQAPVPTPAPRSD